LFAAARDNEKECAMASLTQSLPQALRDLRVRPLFVMRLEVPPLFVIGPTPDAFRRIGVIQGGAFEGERLSGVVLNGNDWQAVRTTRAPSSTFGCC
jgi:hypothetical protein